MSVVGACSRGVLSATAAVIGGADSERDVVDTVAVVDGVDVGCCCLDVCSRSLLGFRCMTGEELLARFSSSASSSLSLVEVVAAAVVPLKRSVAHCLTLHPSPS